MKNSESESESEYKVTYLETESYVVAEVCGEEENSDDKVVPGWNLVVKQEFRVQYDSLHHYEYVT